MTEKDKKPKAPVRQIIIEIEGPGKVDLAKNECASDFELIAILQFVIDWVKRGRK